MANQVRNNVERGKRRVSKVCCTEQKTFSLEHLAKSGNELKITLQSVSAATNPAKSLQFPMGPWNVEGKIQQTDPKHRETHCTSEHPYLKQLLEGSWGVT